MSDINPNVAVNEAAPVEANGGDAVTFDELDALTSKKTKEPEKKVEKKEAKEEKPKDLTSDDKKGEVKKEKDGEDKEKPKAEKKGKEEEESELEKSGDDSEDSKPIKVKVNGREEEVTLKDLKANYSGKIAWDKKFSELDKQNKAIKADNERLMSSANKIREMFQEQDPQIRMFKMAEIAGVDPVEFYKKMTEDNINHLEKWQSMSEDERRAELLDYERSYYKHQLETRNAADKSKQDQESLNAHINQVRATHNLNEDEFSKSYQDLSYLVKNGTISQEQLTPEYVAEIAVKERYFDLISSEMSKVKHNLDDKQLSKKMVELTNDAFALKLSPKAIMEVIDGSFGVSKARKIVEKKQEQRDEFVSGKKSVTAHKEDRDIWSFEDL